MITVRCRRRRRKWDDLHFDLTNVPRSKLSLILTLAADGVAAAQHPEAYADIAALVAEIDRYLNAEEFVHLTPLKLESY